MTSLILVAEKLVLMYLSANNVEFHLSVVYLLAPIMHCMSDPCSIYFSFVALQVIDVLSIRAEFEFKLRIILNLSKMLVWTAF
jgi:hypothetical protein